MTLKWSLVLVAAFIATVSAQSTSVQPIPTTSSMMAAAPSTMAPMASPTPSPMPPSPAVGELDERFNLNLAEQTRSNHFYCLGANGARADFQNGIPPSRWGLWIQYPVLSYLDSMRKRHLFYVISRMTTEDIFNSICVAEVEHYGVSSYSESVFVKLYLRNVTDDNVARDTISRLNTAFIGSYMDGNPYVVRFLGRRAINVTSTEPSNGLRLSERTVNDSVLAGCGVDSCPDGDPTLLAVVLGTYVGPWYYGEGEERREVTVELLRSGRLTGYTPLENFASNPNPINFGLEAGDIVFAVFGSIFLTLLSAAIVIGFFVHPFFFA